MRFLPSMYGLVIAVTCVHSQCLAAPTITGRVVDLAGVGREGVTVEVLAVDVTGVLSNTVIDSDRSKANGVFSVDTKGNSQVVLRFFGGGSKEVFMPEPTRNTNSRTGGAMFVDANKVGVDVVVPVDQGENATKAECGNCGRSRCRILRRR